MNGSKSTSKGGTDGKVDSDKIDPAIPWGIYIPPSTGDNSHVLLARKRREEGNDDDAAAVALPNKPHGGYVRIVDARGKSFPCGFSRPIGYVMDTVVVASRKKSRPSQGTSDDETAAAGQNRGENGNARADDETSGDVPAATREAHPRRRKKTVAEERLHPEEALFLHMRGLLRIEANSSSVGGSMAEEGESTAAAKAMRTMSTQDLICQMLPECNVPLAAYLAYAHLRAQGFVLIRYTNLRMQLLRKMRDSDRRRELRDDSRSCATAPEGENKGENLDCVAKKILNNDEDETVSQSDNGKGLDSVGEKMPNIGVRETVTKNDNGEGLDSVAKKKLPNNDEHEAVPQNDKAVNSEGNVSGTLTNLGAKPRPLRLQLSDDVAAAPPPCVALLQTVGDPAPPNIRLAYYAYNPNASFRRTNPGLPNFGVAVMPYHSGDGTGPSFGNLSFLVSMCEGGGGRPKPEGDADEGINDAAASGIPLRVATVADGGAVIVFGVTSGDVPSINQANSYYR